MFWKISSTRSKLTWPSWKVFKVKPNRAVGKTSLSTYRIKATKPPIVINPLSNWKVPNDNKINNEIEEIPCNKGNRVLAVLASFIAEFR